MSGTTYDAAEAVLNATELTSSECHGLLASDRRRLAIDALEGETAPVELDDFASEIAARETGTDEDERTTEQVAISLHHVHLPKMDEAGILEYDPTNHLIEPREFSLHSGSESI